MKIQLKATALFVALSIGVYLLTPYQALAQTPIPLSSGEHLFIDDYLIESKTGISRVVVKPQRFRTAPVIGGLEAGSAFKNYNFSADVIRDSQTGQFRIWFDPYNTQVNVRVSATTTSADGIIWSLPYQEIANTQDVVFQNVIDMGPGFQPAFERYRMILPDRNSLPPPLVR